MAQEISTAPGLPEKGMQLVPPFFNDPAQERNYRQHNAVVSLTRHRIANSLAIMLYLGFGLLDRLLQEPLADIFLVIRGLFSLWLAFALWATWQGFWKKYNQAITALSALLGSCGIAAMIAIATHQITQTTFFAGNVLIMMFASGFGLLRTSIAFATTLVSGAVTLAAVTSTIAETPAILADAIFLLSAMVTATASSLILDLAERNSWARQETIAAQRDLIEAEKARADGLLQNILPETIAARLKQGERPIADAFLEVTVLFADVVNFTPLAERLGPDRLVELLDDLFSSFDSVAQQFGVEKVKTVGDAYMAVCGAPEHVNDHAQRMVRFACEIVEIARAAGLRHGHRIEVRVGVNTGPVVAGVIGRQRITYDLWGDTVNMANRIESIAPAGHITLSQRTQEILGPLAKSSPREVQIKGKGVVRVHDLLALA